MTGTDTNSRPITPFTQVLNEHGEQVAAPPALDDETLRGMMRLMKLGRHLDAKAISLQRRGKLGTFAPMSGQEAATVGSIFAMDPVTDWVVPQYREQLAMLHSGLTISTYLLQRQGNPVGSALPTATRLFPQQVALAAHLPHAVGAAWGSRLRGEQSAAICYFGDGASSEGDFHEACNLAGVLKVPVIFLCQNNQWAISTPFSRQTAASSIADRAPGYGIAGERVDGNDVLAMYAATARARARGLAGDGPTLIEAVTYRLGAHTTADDPTRYVDSAAAEAWKTRDPLLRYGSWLRATGRWDDDAEAECDAWCTAQIDAGVEGLNSAGDVDPHDLFRNLYAEEPVTLARQRKEFERFLEEKR